MRGDGRRCGEPLDALGRHALVCGCGAGRLARHNDLRDTLGAVIAQTTGDAPAKEVAVPAWSTPTATAVLDLALAGTNEFVDVTVTYPHQRGSSTSDGAAARLAEDAKRRKYPGARLVPAAWEVLGRVGEPLAAFLRRLHRGTLAERAEGMADAWGSLSAALQRGNANMIAAAARTSYRAPPAAAAAPPAAQPAAPAPPAVAAGSAASAPDAVPPVAAAAPVAGAPAERPRIVRFAADTGTRSGPY